MIRSLPLICSTCGKEFVPQEQLYYRHEPTLQDVRSLKLVCRSCIDAWLEKWRVASALFQERDYVLTVTVTLENGTVYENLDCTPLEEEELVITGEDMPEAAQRQLYEKYSQWQRERDFHQLEDCFFVPKEDGTFSVSLLTRGGERYDDLIVTFAEDGCLVTNRAVPDYISAQLSVALKAYKAQEIKLTSVANPLPRSARSGDNARKRHFNTGFSDSYSENNFGNSFTTREKPWKI